MKAFRFALALATGLLCALNAYADVKISALPAGAALAGTEPVPAVQGGATVRTTPAAIAAYAILTGTTGSIGGGALIAGACASGTVGVTNAATTMVAVATPNTYPGDGAVWSAQVTSAGTVTVRVCALVALTPTASTYNVRVIR